MPADIQAFEVIHKRSADNVILWGIRSTAELADMDAEAVGFRPLALEGRLRFCCHRHCMSWNRDP